MLVAVIVVGLALIALCLILIAISFVGRRSRVLFEGVLEFVEVESFFGNKARVRYFFSTYFSEELRSSGHLLEARSVCVLPLELQNNSGSYIPKEGHNIRITIQENIFKEALSFRVERLPDLNPDDLYQFSQSAEVGSIEEEDAGFD